MQKSCWVLFCFSNAGSLQPLVVAGQAPAPVAEQPPGPGARPSLHVLGAGGGDGKTSSMTPPLMSEALPGGFLGP